MILYSLEADPCATNNTCRFEPQYPECPIEERIKLNGMHLKILVRNT